MPTLVEDVEIKIGPMDLDHGNRIQWQSAAISFTVRDNLLRIRRQCICIRPPWFIETHAIEIEYYKVGYGKRRRFVCECGRNARVLYLPEGATRFRCQKCCKLVHRCLYQHQGLIYKMAKGDLKTLEAEIAKGSVLAIKALAVRLRWELYGKGTRWTTILRQQTKNRVG